MSLENLRVAVKYFVFLRRGPSSESFWCVEVCAVSYEYFTTHMIKLVASQCLILTSPKLVVPVGFVSRIPSRITHGRVCPAVLSGRVLSSALLWSLVLGRCEFEKLAWWGPPLGAKARLVLRADLFEKPAIHTCTWTCFVWSWPSRSRGRSMDRSALESRLRS